MSSNNSSNPSRKAKPPTCKSCHQRKIRCDGGNPCGSCSRARAPLVCAYSSSLARPELPKGAACIPCRQRKRKCDGNHPCLTCTKTLVPDICQYRERIPRLKPRNGDLIIQRHLTSVGERGFTPLSWTDVPSEPVEPTRTVVQVLDGICADVDLSLPWLGPVGDMTECTPALSAILHSEGVSSFSAAAASCDPQLDQATELFAVRNLFLEHCWQYGLNVSREKRDAIARGDTSGAIVHPVLIHGCQLMGYMIASREPTERWAYLKERTDIEVEQRQRVLDLLESPHPEVPDPVSCIQAYKLLALSSAFKMDLRGFQEFLGNAGNLALRHDVALGLDDSFELAPRSETGIPPCGPVEEGRSALAHMVYIEIAASILMKFPPKLPPVLHAKFSRLAAKNNKETELNFVKASSVCLLLESQQLVAEWNRWESGYAIGIDWRERYRTLASTIQGRLQVLNTALVELTDLHELQALTFKGSLIMLLAALAELYAIFAPFHAETWRRHHNIISAIARIIRPFSTADHEYFDCTLSVCLDIASREILEQVPTPRVEFYLATLVPQVTCQ
ncbi:hypothetical protein C8R44DRAFT_781532 [Mycena epipterygia]|nr:hypothetical protein C8R44DRAFT_781532 [Mycena epipterygia]